MAADAQAEFEEFVEGTVVLGEATPSPPNSPGGFTDLVGRLSASSGAGRFDWSVLIGAALMLAAGVLAVLLPGEAATDDGFWRVGQQAGADLLRFGGHLALTLVVGSFLLVCGSLAALAGPNQLGRTFLAAQPLVGVGALGLVALVWLLYGALILANLAALALLIVAYAIGTVLGIAFFLALLAGIADQ
ncbi:MAG: hypothetical protein KC438_09100 [Thermomicrobiales bacterium]|nr:hypothetical protein [Thermomicrobiales bacterium]